MKYFVQLIVFLLFFSGCGKDVTIVHINDTHSHLFGSEVNCRYKGEPHNFSLGGLDLITQSVRDLRKEKGKVLFLHAGDLLQGTRYFKEFQGVADVEAMNSAGLEALALGNHEFDKGHEFLSNLLEKAKFPVLAANIEFDEGISLKDIVKPYIVTGYWPFKNAVIGVITPDTGEISSPGKGIRFTDPAEAVRKHIAELKKRSVTRIFVLSHLGFKEDIELAKKVEGIDVIIGGHSHTMLGFTGIECLNVKGEYPEIVKDPSGRDVLIVQAWDHARAVGVIDLKFDFKGEISKFEGKTVYPLRETEKIPFTQKLSPFNEFQYVKPDTDIAKIFNNYKDLTSKDYSIKVGHIAGDLEHRWEKGSDVAPLVAEAILWKAKHENIKVDIALQNAGGVRQSISAGEITLGEVSDTLPFFNNLVIFQIKGSDLVLAIKQSIDNVFSGIHLGSFPYLAGMEYEIKDNTAINFRVFENDMETPVDPDKIYTVATDSYIAFGGNGYDLFAHTTDKEITPYIISEIFAEYITEKKEIYKPLKKHPAVQ